RIINDASHAQFVEWSTSGESFFITDVPAFENILPNHYKHRQFSSFVRQINMYGFTKINRGMKEDKRVFEFAHPAFLRGRIDLLPLIRRK
ncbi:HSF-type DNA-binding-domain-containing protein, partial [Blastocladiella britannica]